MQSSQKTIGKLKIGMAALGVALIVIGILFLIFPATYMSIICYVAGAALMIFAVVTAAMYFADGMKTAGSLAMSAFLFALGILFIVRQGTMQEFVALAIGLVLLADGFSKLQETIDLFRAGRKIWIVLMLEAVVFAALGIIALAQPFGAGTTLGYFLGACLIVEGAVNVVTAIVIARREKKAAPVPLHEVEEDPPADGEEPAPSGETKEETK